MFPHIKIFLVDIMQFRIDTDRKCKVDVSMCDVQKDNIILFESNKTYFSFIEKIF